MLVGQAPGRVFRARQTSISTLLESSVKAKPETKSTETLSTKAREYTTLMEAKGGAWWKKALDVQAPYRWKLRRLNLGFVLDVGCGIGRNLINLRGHGVGIDHNRYSVQRARSRGLQAFTPEEFKLSEFDAPERFDSILMAHVAEHMTELEAVELLRRYLSLLRPQGRTILITPQEYSFSSDPTHIQFMTFQNLRAIGDAVGLELLKEFSFPFPRMFGHVFKYNEFVSVFKKV